MASVGLSTIDMTDPEPIRTASAAIQDKAGPEGTFHLAGHSKSADRMVRQNPILFCYRMRLNQLFVVVDCEGTPRCSTRDEPGLVPASVHSCHACENTGRG